MTLSRTLAALASAIALAAASPAAETQLRVNQLGLLPDGTKQAVIPHASARPINWSLVDEAGRVVASGQSQRFGPDRWSSEEVHRIDFSAIRAPGIYRLQAGGATSRPIRIAADTYARLPFDAFAYFYHNRAGTPIEAHLVGQRWARPAGHPKEVATCVSGADPNGNVWPGCPYSLDVTGGWYDAGDHGKYVVNGGISLWTLLNLHERNQLRANALFADGSAAIPEAGNGVSDLLDEARWEMEFLLRMHAPDGARQRLPVGVKKNEKGLSFADVDTSGMAHHKVADEKWTALPLRPDQDQERRQLFPPSTGATLNLAATAAQCARIWRTIDAAFADRCLNAAKRAWAAGRRNPEIYAIADFTGSGAYGDDDLSDEFYWAAAELLATTGEQEYRRAVEGSPHHRAGVMGEASWNSVASLGTITLAMAPDVLSQTEQQRLRGSIQEAGDRFLRERAQMGYAIPFAGEWTWGSTSNLLNRAMLLALAHDFTGDRRYRDGVIDLMDFILGRNPLDQSFVSGYGARPMQNPHHRFWAHSLSADFPPPPPGALSGGPNNRNMADEVAAKMKGTCAPQTCWVDNIHAFSLNEVAINWNAPLVWVSAWLAAPGEGSRRGERG